MIRSKKEARLAEDKYTEALRHWQSKVTNTNHANVGSLVSIVMRWKLLN